MIQGGERRGAPALEGGWERAPGKGLTQRSRIITHMAGNAYFTLIKSVFFFVRLSEDPPALPPRAPPARPAVLFLARRTRPYIVTESDG